MTTQELKQFFEDRSFNVFLSEQEGIQSAEVESWTDCGVDMIIGLNPFTKEEFIQWVNNFDIDEEIELHRQDEQYKKVFTISLSLEDFTKYHNVLKELVEQIEKS